MEENQFLQREPPVLLERGADGVSPALTGSQPHSGADDGRQATKLSAADSIVDRTTVEDSGNNQ